VNTSRTRTLRTISARRVALTVALAVSAAACSDGGGGSADPTAAAETTVGAAETTAAPETSAAAPDTSVTAPDTTEAVAPDTAPAVLGELDDLDEDGTFDERCGTADLGGGLVVETLCNTALVPTPEDGVQPLPGSLLLLPTPARWEDLADVDAVVKVATRPDGSRVVIYVLGSDTLFDSGSAAVRSTAQPPLAAVVASIAARFPGQPISVRGAADSVGDPAANQTLSEQRAASVAAQLTALGLPASSITSVGLGELVPVAAETNPDGSVSEIGRQVNRRVEIVVG
jgi:outer membrane protein OmpA-like peptidoglycan-associated protein